MRAEAERLRPVLESMAGAIIVVDQRGEIVLANAHAQTLFGYKQQELIGQPIDILLPERVRERHVADREQFTAQPRARRMGPGRELLALRKDGTEFPVEVSLSRMPSAHGVLIAGMVSDITARKRSEAAVAQLASIVESSEDAIVGENLDGTITSWNPAAERIYGYAADDVVGQHVSILCPDRQQVEELEQILSEVAAGSRVDHFETTRRRKDGALIDISVTVSPVRDRAGEIVGASTIARDVTERKRSVTALAEAEERFRGAFEEAPIGMALLHLDGSCAQVNATLSEITGYETAQLQGTELHTLMHPDDAGDLIDAITTIADGGETLYVAERRFVHASGHPVWVSLQVTGILDAGGRPLRLLAQVQDITDRKRYEDRLQDLADHDHLTGLLNRHSFSRELESQATLVGRYGSEGALLMLDLDHFKYINDTLGHQAGDEIIVRVAELLSRRTRESDVLARLGGDEFAILLPKADIPTAERVAAELVHAFAQEELTITGVGRRSIAASIGIATFEPQFTGEDVLVNADLAMYDAKEAGRNRVATYRTDDRSQARMKGRFSWVQRIQAAFAEDRFSLLAQPIVDYATGRPSQQELLLRMRDEHDDLIPPGAFLYIAERLDLVQQIDAWVVKQAIALLADGGPRGEGLPVSVNLSGRSLGDAKLLELIEHELARTAVAPQRLTFEITETAAVRHVTHARRFSERLAELGCRLALDDFGAGFGSFYYLKHLPFDYLKIDGEFVRNCRSSKTDRLVIEAVVRIAQGLGKSTIAEFVGDDETVRLLTRLGVDYGQGYHHGRPAPIAIRGSRAPDGVQGSRGPAGIQAPR